MSKRPQSKRDDFSKFIDDARDHQADRNERHSRSADQKHKQNKVKPNLETNRSSRNNKLSDEPTDEAVEHHFRAQLGLDAEINNGPVPDESNLLDQTLSGPDPAWVDPEITSEAPTQLEPGFASQWTTEPIELDPVPVTRMLEDVPTSTDRLESTIENPTTPVASENINFKNAIALNDPLLSFTHAGEISQTINRSNSGALASRKDGHFSALSADSAAVSAGIDPSAILNPDDGLLGGNGFGGDLADAQSGNATLMEPSNATTEQDFNSTFPLTRPVGADARTAQTQEPHVPYSPEVVKNVTQTVTENLVQAARFSDNGSNKQLVVQLHPAELGQLVLQVDWDNDVLKAKIVTSELAASEMLNQQKQHLISALAENGLHFDSLDVGFQDTPQDQPESRRSQSSEPTLAPESDGESESQETSIQLNNPSESKIDLVA